MATLVALGTLARVTVVLHVAVEGVGVAASAAVDRVQVLVAFEMLVVVLLLLLVFVAALKIC